LSPDQTRRSARAHQARVRPPHFVRHFNHAVLIHQRNATATRQQYRRRGQTAVALTFYFDRPYRAHTLLIVLGPSASSFDFPPYLSMFPFPFCYPFATISVLEHRSIESVCYPVPPRLSARAPRHRAPYLVSHPHPLFLPSPLFTGLRHPLETGLFNTRIRLSPCARSV